jgi:hypothetical protein
VVERVIIVDEAMSDEEASRLANAESARIDKVMGPIMHKVVNLTSEPTVEMIESVAEMPAQ